jgi:hypothetical protein
MLTAPDDVFATGLRLVGRCVANGAAVRAELRDEVGSRLAKLWGKAHYDLRERVGRLLVDAYSKPLHPEVRRRLSWRWLLGSGAGEIISQSRDPALTAAVVDEILAGELEMFMNLRDFEGALQEISGDVAAKVATRARATGASEDVFDGLVEFLERISVSPEHSAPLRDLTSDTALPIRLRLAALGAAAEPPGDAALNMAADALAGDDWRAQSTAARVFKRCPDPANAIGALLTATDAPDRAKAYLVEHMDRIFAGTDERGEAARRILERPGLSERNADILCVYRLRAGDRRAMEKLVERLDMLPAEVANAVLVSLNRFPDRKLGLRALEKVRARSDAASDVPGLAGSALTGLTMRITSDGWNHYGMESAPPHPALDAWATMFDRWLAVSELTRVERLRILNSVVESRPDLVEEIREVIFSATDPDGAEWDEDDSGHHLGRGMNELRRRRIGVPPTLAEAFALARRPNLSYAGISALKAPATQEALNRLLSLYTRIEHDRRFFTLSAIEVVASRLNVAITEEVLSRGSL